MLCNIRSYLTFLCTDESFRKMRLKLKTLSLCLGISAIGSLLVFLELYVFDKTNKVSHHGSSRIEEVQKINLRSIASDPAISMKLNETINTSAAAAAAAVVRDAAPHKMPLKGPVSECRGGKCAERFRILNDDVKDFPYDEVLRRVNGSRVLDEINPYRLRLPPGAKCNQRCQFERRKTLRRPLIEAVDLPKEWTASEGLKDRLQHRKMKVAETCKKFGLSQRTPSNQPNAWEFLVNKKYNLVWCTIFKAASSTWMFNFNLLAGYSEKYLLSWKNTPIALARKKYPRPSVEELDAVLNDTNRPLTFMIVRNPFNRLVSGYRDKFQKISGFYRNLSRTIVSTYPQYGPPVQMNPSRYRVIPNRYNARNFSPSFSQFVQYVIDAWKAGRRLDEHWERQETFCTPCLVDFDVFAKVETLDEDGNFIIFNSGIEKVIRPKRINRSRNEPTDLVASSFLCSLTQRQMKDLIKMYQIDLEMFEYDAEKYIECTNFNVPKDYSDSSVLTRS